MVKDVGGFRHLHHERGLAGAEVITGSDAREDAIGDAQSGGAGGNPAADLRHQLQQPGLAQIAALAAGVGPREHEQIGMGIAPQADGVGGEGFLHQQLFHHRVAPRLDLQQPGLRAIRVGDLGPAVAGGGSQLRQGGQGIELGHPPCRRPDRPGLGAHLLTQRAEQVVFPLAGPGLQLQDAPFAALELRGHKPLFVGQGLAADPVLRHPLGLGFAHRQEITKGAVVLELEGGDAAGAPFGGLLLGQPGVLVVELVA